MVKPDTHLSAKVYLPSPSGCAWIQHPQCSGFTPPNIPTRVPARRGSDFGGGTAHIWQATAEAQSRRPLSKLISNRRLFRDRIGQKLQSRIDLRYGRAMAGRQRIGDTPVRYRPPRGGIMPPLQSLGQSLFRHRPSLESYSGSRAGCIRQRLASPSASPTTSLRAAAS